MGDCFRPEWLEGALTGGRNLFAFGMDGLAASAGIDGASGNPVPEDVGGVEG